MRAGGPAPIHYGTRISGRRAAKPGFPGTDLRGGDPRAGNFGISLKTLWFSLMCETTGHRNFRLRGARGAGGGKTEFSLKVFVLFGPKISLINIKKKRALRARVSARDFLFLKNIFLKQKICFKIFFI